MNNDLTHVTIVLDASGSMKAMKEGVIEGFNDFFREQTEVDGRMTATLYEFSSTQEWTVNYDSGPISNGQDFQNLNTNKSDVRRKFRARDINQDVPELTDGQYSVGGMTPLYDAMGQAIDETGQRLAALPESERPGNVILFTLTDGQENDSTTHTAEDIGDRIDHQRNVYDWEFIFAGAGEDAILESKAVRVSNARSANFEQSDAGVKMMMQSTTANVSAYRSTGDENALRYDEYDGYESDDE